MSFRTLVVSGISGKESKTNEFCESSELCEFNQAGDSGAAKAYCIALCEFYCIELIELGKPHVRIFSVQPEFCRKGGGLNRLAKWVVAVL